MSIETINKGQWIFLERSLPGYFIYKLIEGKVAIFHSGEKISDIEVKKGDKPALIGMISALRPDGLHIASVRSETNLQVERIYSDQIRGIVNNEVPDSIRNDLKKMIEAVVIRNEIEALKIRLKTLGSVNPEIPDNIHKDVKDVMEGIKILYNNPEKQ